MTEQKKNQNQKQNEEKEKTSPGKIYDFFGEIDPKVNKQQECAKTLNIIMDTFGLKVIGEQYKTVYLRGIGSIELTFKEYCQDVKDIKLWLRNGINKL